ncbi:hypothetical protein AGMMS50293_01100 [Spirochaetia bacterium]|nr:hypothetical protein AGMMS50293_01100 [Spirochaetia bacterium]
MLKYFSVFFLGLLLFSCDLRPLPDYESVARFVNAVRENKMDEVQDYIKKYKDICMFVANSPVAEIGMVAAAVTSGNIEMVKLMVENNASVNILNQPGSFTALETALQMNNFEMFTYLLEHNADPRNVDILGNNIFHALADKYRNINAAKLLESYFPDLINQRNIGGFTPLAYVMHSHITAECFQDEEELAFLKYYLDHGADVLQIIGAFKGNDLYTVLIQRKENDYLKLVFSYVDKKLPNAFDKMNYVQIAIYFSNFEIVSLFIPLVEDINQQDEYGKTALHRAVYFAGYDTIKLLLDSGSDKTIKDEDGMTAYDIYIQNHMDYSNEIIDLLK